jgi:hypothetical protein
VPGGASACAGGLRNFGQRQISPTAFSARISAWHFLIMSPIRGPWKRLFTDRYQQIAVRTNEGADARRNSLLHWQQLGSFCKFYRDHYCRLLNANYRSLIACDPAEFRALFNGQRQPRHSIDGPRNKEEVLDAVGEQHHRRDDPGQSHHTSKASPHLASSSGQASPNQECTSEEKLAATTAIPHRYTTEILQLGDGASLSLEWTMLEPFGRRQPTVGFPHRNDKFVANGSLGFA